ncbi:MAG: small ribosomal subunit Rsm22 family protein [Deltaproteobacteria bacterium]|nr:small ribosomal subunit Rsm22 family protein [Deltaproteobacteria bacterium]
MNEFLKKLEEIIQTYLKETYLPPHRAKTPGWNYHDLRFFSKGVDALSTAFTEGRSELPKNYFNKKEFRSAYILYFLLINAAKVWKSLEEAAPFIKKGPLKILDVGSGPGTAALTASAFFADRPIEITGLEQNPGIQKDALGLWKMMPVPQHRFIAKTVSLYSKNIARELQKEKYDIIFAANFLNELPEEEQLKLCELFFKHTSLIIIIEPALQETTRTLMRLRDLLLEKKLGAVLAPCLHQQRCPMLGHNARDWCHFYINWKCPLTIRQVDQEIGNKHDYVKMAYMIFDSRRVSNVGHETEGLWRTVSSPLISNGKKEIIFCGDCGLLKKIERLNKEKTITNTSFDYARRGDIVEWKGETRVGAEDKIPVIKKF